MKDIERDQYLRRHGFVIIRISGCEWEQKKKESELPESPISALLYKKFAKPQELLNSILTGGVYGFAIVDIVAGEGTQKFIETNWLPIIRHDEIQFDDLPDWMKRPDLEKTFPRKTLVQTMHGKEMLLHTRVIQWYVENGFKITKVSYIFHHSILFYSFYRIYNIL